MPESVPSLLSFTQSGGMLQTGWKQANMPFDLHSILQPWMAQLAAYHVDQPTGMIKLDANENSCPHDPEFVESLGPLLKEVALNRYPDPAATRLTGEISRAWGVPRECIVLGNGSDEFIPLMTAAFGRPRKPGKDRGCMLYPTPTFSMFRIGTIGFGCEVLEVPLDRRWQLDEAAIHGALDEHQPNVCYFATPNNPTGALFDEQVITRVIERGESLVVVDEAYADFSGASWLDRLERWPNLVEFRTFSKIGFAALRLGVMMAPPAVAHEIHKVRGPYNIGGLTQAIALHALRRPESWRKGIELIRRERQRLDAELRRFSQLEVFPSDANFILCRVRTGGPELFEALKSRRILIRNLHSPGVMENLVRITVGVESENTRLLEALAEILSAT
ncbi:MAG: Histidinol-phosphate aminotransferase 2 [Myxococcota bacterium]|nr:Histidinol-phosphate aminotransferase 2 [Myxococcota bacterium]